MQNRQYTFQFDNPLVKSLRVNIKLEQADTRMLESNQLSPPFSETRTKIGFVVLEMAKAVDTVNYYEPKTQVTYVKPQAAQFVTGSFEIQSKKYCVIPLTANKGDVASYAMSIQFPTEQKYITLGKKYSSDSMETHAEAAEAIEKFNGLPAFQRKVLTPYTLDKLINTREKAKP